MNRRGFLASLLGAIAGPPAAAALLLPPPKQEQSGIALARQAQREWEECPQIQQIGVDFETEPGEDELDEHYHWPALRALIAHIDDEARRGALGFRCLDLPLPRCVEFAASYTVPAPAGGDALKIRYIKAWNPWNERGDSLILHRYDVHYWWLHPPPPRPTYGGNRIVTNQGWLREGLRALQANLATTRQINRAWDREFVR